jgi:hypothetical protein
MFDVLEDEISSLRVQRFGCSDILTYQSEVNELELDELKLDELDKN